MTLKHLTLYMFKLVCLQKVMVVEKEDLFIEHLQVFCLMIYVKNCQTFLFLVFQQVRNKGRVFKPLHMMILLLTS